MSRYLAWYNRHGLTALLYMLQQVNYDPRKFLSWLVRVIKQKQSLLEIMKRQNLVMTSRVRALLVLTVLVEIMWFLFLIALFNQYMGGLWLYLLVVLLLLILPVARVFILLAISTLAYIFVTRQQFSVAVKSSEEIFANSKAIKIAVAGSYGKTTVKELLSTILSEGLEVVATPGNMNTPIAHARFAKKLTGREDVLIIEYGEERPGDIARFAKNTHPDYAIITGVAPNHLEYYKTIERLINDIFSLRAYIDPKKLYITGENERIQSELKPDDITFDASQAAGWLIDIKSVSIEGSEFELKKGTERMHLKTSLLGRHLVPVVAIVAVIARELGLTIEQIEKGVSKTMPYEHRMQPYQLGGAWLIDDTYNGNRVGVLAGLNLLAELHAKRKIYITPGLVDQGDQVEVVHYEIAKKIYDVAPDIVVLMKNSATSIVKEALDKLGYKGRVQTVKDPLQFYTALEQFVVPGDLVLMQNDWTDNYN